MGLSNKNYAVNQKHSLEQIVGRGKFSSGKEFAVKAVNPQGFIDCQWGLSHCRYGLRRSDKNGCGWVAAYNLLKILGESPRPEDLIREFERFGVVFGLFGTTALAFPLYFMDKGYRVRPLFTWNKDSLSKLLRQNKGAVLFYFHPKPLKGAHFVTVRWANIPEHPDRFIFYNALNRPLQPTGRKLAGIPLYRLEVPEDIRTLDQFVQAEKAYYHSRWFPSPFLAFGVSPPSGDKPKGKKGYSFQEIYLEE